MYGERRVAWTAIPAAHVTTKPRKRVYTMSTLTAAHHCPSELTLVACDDMTGIVTFAAASKHDASRINHVSLDTTNGDILCTCKASECHKSCWHETLVVAAWERTEAAHIARLLSPVALLNQGRKHARMVATYRARNGRALADDVLILLASRYEWRRRVRLGVIVGSALPVAA